MERIIRTVGEMQQYADAVRAEGKKIALVPTMGALHEGHMSLIRCAVPSNDIVVCSIFINPTQFGPNEDLEAYPRTFEEDVKKAMASGATVIFAPTADQMYTSGHATFVVNDQLERVLEGKERPGHFKGVATVVLKLFAAVKPHAAIFGQKDAQQLAVIRMMVRDLGLDVEIITGPIVREPDGLAMSSRNVYLSDDERKRAVAISQSLKHAEARLADGERSVAVLKSGIRDDIEAARPAAIDYIECVDPDTFNVLETFREDGTLIVVVARFGTTRLLDNILLTG